MHEVKRFVKKDRMRFSFGANWQSFLNRPFPPERINNAVDSLRSFLRVNDLEDRTFLDVGCGSGLFSLAARKLGAKVYSFDLDPLSIACAEELRRRFSQDDEKWTIHEGDVLDGKYLSSLGQFDVVYAWGVLHHTGAMWQALENVIPLVSEGGELFISIYNDQGRASRRWAAVKRCYNRSSKLTQFFLTVTFLGYFGIPKVLLRLKKERGMSFWHDLIDWLGGYPFEVAKPEEVFDFFRERGFGLARLRTRGGRSGCNEFLFVRPSPKEGYVEGKFSGKELKKEEQVYGGSANFKSLIPDPTRVNRR